MLTRRGLGLTTAEFEPWNDPQAKPLIHFQNVTKRFGQFTAIDDLTIDIYEREFYALLGPSGCGKTTLMRMLAGFETPTEGTIHLAGQDIVGVPPNKRATNMMFQSYALFPHMSVVQNIAFGLKQDKLPKAEIAARVQEMLKLVHMEAYAKRRPNQLSGGQRQRVALARSLAKRPKLLLLDEPMGALDKKLRTQMQLEVVDILEAVGVTCVMVTHDQEEAMTMAGRISIMNEGWIAQTGTPTDIYESPSSRMVAEFIGSVNLFEGEIIQDQADHLMIATAGLSQNIFIDHGVSTSVEDKTVWVAVRPEKTRITREQPQGEYNWSSGVVEDIAYLGGISVYYIRLPNKQLIQTIMTNRERRSDPPTWEEAVFISWEATSGVVLRS